MLPFQRSISGAILGHIIHCYNLVTFILGNRDLLLKIRLGPNGVILAIPVVILLVFAPIAGWLADKKLGNYKMIRIGYILLTISSTLGCVCVLVLGNVESHNKLYLIFCSAILPLVVYFLLTIGALS